MLTEEYYDFLIDDFLNLPDNKNHPALALLARRDEQLQHAIQRQGFQSRQGPLGGILAAASTPFSVRIINAKLFGHLLYFTV